MGEEITFVFIALLVSKSSCIHIQVAS